MVAYNILLIYREKWEDPVSAEVGLKDDPGQKEEKDRPAAWYHQRIPCSKAEQYSDPSRTDGSPLRWR